MSKVTDKRAINSDIFDLILEDSQKIIVVDIRVTTVEFMKD
jgi:hypothetical protein